eukprot:gene13366-biopygen23040
MWRPGVTPGRRGLPLWVPYATREKRGTNMACRRYYPVLKSWDTMPYVQSHAGAWKYKKNASEKCHIRVSGPPAGPPAWAGPPKLRGGGVIPPPWRPGRMPAADRVDPANPPGGVIHPPRPGWPALGRAGRAGGAGPARPAHMARTRGLHCALPGCLPSVGITAADAGRTRGPHDSIQTGAGRTRAGRGPGAGST